MSAAGREWVAGPVRVQTSVLSSWVTMLDEPVDVDEVTVADRDGEAFVIERIFGTQARISDAGRHVPTGTIVVCEYEAPGVPAAVTASVAAIVARRLGITPGTPETKFTELTAGADFRAKAAAWVTSTSVLTPDEESEARRYQPAPSSAIIARWN